MTTTPNLSTEAVPAKTDDPTAIDLDELQKMRRSVSGQLSTANIDRLIAAVEALREQVTYLEHKLTDTGK